MTELTTPYGPAAGRPGLDYRNDPILKARPRWRRELYRIIFEHDTPAGKLFDVALIAAILASVAAVMLESVAAVRARSGPALRTAEWIFTILFTLEYGTRLVSARRAGRYARSFFGLIDLLSILPTYLSVLVPGGQALAVVRVLRVLRVFRVLKLARFVGSEKLMLRALRASGYKIAVFLIATVSVAVVVGAAMYFIEGPEAGFTSIPVGMYWAIVTVTTVGFGDITPLSPLGQSLAAMLMILGYGIIAVPTGIVTAEMIHGQVRGPDGRAVGRTCEHCGKGGLLSDSSFCRHCGERLPRPGAPREGAVTPPLDDPAPAPTRDPRPPGGGDAGLWQGGKGPVSIPPGGPRTCLKCGSSGHDPDARHCKRCGMELPG